MFDAQFARVDVGLARVAVPARERELARACFGQAARAAHGYGGGARAVRALDRDAGGIARCWK